MGQSREDVEDCLQKTSSGEVGGELVVLSGASIASIAIFTPFGVNKSLI